VSVCIASIVDWNWFEFKCQWSFDELPKLILEAFALFNLRAFQQKDFDALDSSTYHESEAEKCDDKTEIHDTQKKQQRKCELIFYLHVSDARSRFILILFWYVDWVTGLTFTVSLCATSRWRKRNVIRHRLFELNRDSLLNVINIFRGKFPPRESSNVLVIFIVITTFYSVGEKKLNKFVEKLSNQQTANDLFILIM
jgi:hypothetical protein